jgi:hypothetical protein
MLRTVNFGKAVIHQGVDILIRNRKNTPTSPTIATIRAATRHKFLTAKTRDTIATTTRGDFNTRFINKFHFLSSSKQKPLRHHWAGAFCGEFV